MAKVETYVRPVALYRYRSLRRLDRELEAIEKKFLYCAPFTKLNDPLEGMFTLSRARRVSEDLVNVRDSIITNKAAIGICSFSEVNNHGPMWAHYADEFRGICIKYDFSKMLDTLPQDVTFVRMFYNESVPHVTLSDPEPAKKVLSCKDYRWLYEREWRMFGRLGSVSYANCECVTRVYLGSRMKDSHRADITALLSKQNIPTSEMTFEQNLSDQYVLDFQGTS